jgi:BarA-like signal transduction histidine kinase
MAIRIGSVSLMAHTRLAIVNPNVAAANIQRNEIARVSQPVSGIAMTSAMRYEV